MVLDSQPTIRHTPSSLFAVSINATYESTFKLLQVKSDIHSPVVVKYLFGLAVPEASHEEH